MRNLPFREPLQIQIVHPPLPPFISAPLPTLSLSGIFTTSSKRVWELDDRCQMSCTMWTLRNNKSQRTRAGRRREEENDTGSDSWSGCGMERSGKTSSNFGGWHMLNNKCVPNMYEHNADSAMWVQWQKNTFSYRIRLAVSYILK